MNASEPVMDAVEKVARALHDTDPNPPMHRVTVGDRRVLKTRDWESLTERQDDDYRIQARNLLAAFPQLALEGREEHQLRHKHHSDQTRSVLVPSDLSFWNFEQRTVWETEWSEVQS